jgi:hypothetical protein
MHEELDKWDCYHIANGRSLIRIGEPDLCETPEVWETLYRRWREVIDAEAPRGTRCPAWWEFCTDDLPERYDGEDDTDYLLRVGELSREEIDALYSDDDDADESPARSSELCSRFATQKGGV